jgi:outer membrane lipoprotein-sorting protein
MKKLIIILFALVLRIGAVQAQNPADTVQQILDNYVAAIGGKAALMKVTDLTTSLSSTTDRGTMRTLRRQKSPDKFSVVISANGKEVMTQTSDGESVRMGGMQGNRTLDGAIAQQLVTTNQLFPELRYSADGVKSQYVGTEKVDGKDTYKLSHTSADGSVTWTDNFDQKTGLKVQSIVGGGSLQGMMNATMMYSDYKATSGILFPMTVKQQSGRGAITMKVDNIKINKGLKDADFTVN